MNISLITAPEYKKINNDHKKIFIAGGITGCPDWQQDFIDIISQSVSRKPLYLFNPRRQTFDVSNPKESEIQMEWEKYHLETSDIICFWFPKESICPITLFEYGFYLNSDKKIYIGCETEYSRIKDIKYQTYLRYPDMKINETLNDLVSNLLTSEDLY